MPLFNFHLFLNKIGICAIVSVNVSKAEKSNLKIQPINLNLDLLILSLNLCGIGQNTCYAWVALIFVSLGSLYPHNRTLLYSFNQFKQNRFFLVLGIAACHHTVCRGTAWNVSTQRRRTNKTAIFFFFFLNRKSSKQWAQLISVPIGLVLVPPSVLAVLECSTEPPSC